MKIPVCTPERGAAASGWARVSGAHAGGDAGAARAGGAAPRSAARRRREDGAAVCAVPGDGDEAASRDLGRELVELRDFVRPCERCGNIAEASPGVATICSICRDERRDPALLCIVARVQDLLAIERSGAMRGRYFVLGRLLSPLEGVGADELPLDALRARVKGTGTRCARSWWRRRRRWTEATALLIARELGALGVNVTRIASGIPHGGDLEFADQVTLGRAIEGRKTFG